MDQRTAAPQDMSNFMFLHSVRRLLAALFAFGWLAPAMAQGAGAEAALESSVAQLRHAIGLWNVRTDFLKPDGSVARSVDGTYEFAWVVEDRVVSGRSDIPTMKRVSGILFYINAARSRIEMASVGADGTLWIMSGPLGGEVRTTQEYTTATGGTGALRFIRSNVTRDAFESRMEYTEDGGKTWTPGNRQYFRRATAQPR